VRLGQEHAALANVWAVMFVCRLVNFISKFVWQCNNNLTDEIRELHSEFPWWFVCTASTTILELLSNTILDHPHEIASRIESKRAIALPSATVTICRQLFIPAAPNDPAESRIHHPHPVKFRFWEKFASTLHFHQLSRGFCQRSS
jgi:hypothetical protein